MTTRYDPPLHTPAPQPPQRSGHRGHGWMMMACCIPMLVIAIVLVATGVVSAGFLFVALGCAAMMYLMMRGMGGMGGDDGHQQH